MLNLRLKYFKLYSSSHKDGHLVIYFDVSVKTVFYFYTEGCTESRNLLIKNSHIMKNISNKMVFFKANIRICYTRWSQCNGPTIQY